MILLLILTASASLPSIPISRDNIVFEKSVRIKPGVYVVQDSDANGVIQVGADNVTIDFQGATLASVSAPSKADQDKFEGFGIAINGHKNVTIKNAKVYGYRWNIWAKEAPQLTVTGCDLSFSRAIQIASQGIPINMFLDLRNLESWRTYGAGLWLEKCAKATVVKVRSCSAQNGIVLANSNGCRLIDNDVSFNSGWGVAFNGSSDNLAAWNLIDFVNRPWAGDWGGDAAGFAVANGSHRNLVVGNSMTHGGDGFFLSDRYNGRYNDQQMKFEGSCDDNIVANNDGSWAPANAFEATFSYRNIFHQNLANDSGYGFWLGYSCDSQILDNDIRNSRTEGIAIEHGKGNLIERNRMVGNAISGVHLWAANGPKHPSADNAIRRNTIQSSRSAIVLQNSQNTEILDNSIKGAPISDGLGSSSKPGVLVAKTPDSKAYAEALALRPKDFVFYRDTGLPTGLQWIRPDDFAPHDFRKDLIVWRKIDDYTIEIFPIATKAKSVAIEHGTDRTVVKQDKSYLVRAVVGSDGIGELKPAAIVARSGKSRFEINAPMLSALWNVRWYEWDRNSLTWNDDAGWEKLFKSEPKLTQKQRIIGGYFAFKSPAPGIGTEYWAFEATTKLRLDRGTYRIDTLADDGIRVFVDGKEIISGWRQTPGTQSGKIMVQEGVHDVRVRFSQSWGHTYLNFDITKLAGQ